MTRSLFPTTRRSVIVALSSDDPSERARAFDALLAIYWKPLYKYARIAHRRDSPDAEDRTQSFLARAFEKSSLATYDESKASFRTFLRTLFDRHLANEIKAETRLKRGGADAHVVLESAEVEIAQEPDRGATPEDYFQREWVRSVFAVAVERLRESSKPEDFDLFDAYDLDETSQLSYRDLAQRAGMSETTVTNRLAAVRRRFREIVLDVLRDATASDREFRAEVRSLLGVDP
jgi:RNA polymerase sigma factor (sigma-70 family)